MFAITSIKRNLGTPTQWAHVGLPQTANGAFHMHSLFRFSCATTRKQHIR